MVSVVMFLRRYRKCLWDAETATSTEAMKYHASAPSGWVSVGNPHSRPTLQSVSWTAMPPPLSNGGSVCWRSMSLSR